MRYSGKPDDRISSVPQEAKLNNIEAAALVNKNLDSHYEHNIVPPAPPVRFDSHHKTTNIGKSVNTSNGKHVGVYYTPIETEI